MTGFSAGATRTLASFFILALIIALAAHAWRRRRLPGAAPFAVACAVAALWVAGAIGESLSIDLAAKVAWYRFQVIWQVPTITAIACFILEYSWPGRWLTRRNLILLSIAPLLMVIVIVTNDFHHLMWLSLTAEGRIAPVNGPLNLLLVFYAISFALVQVVALVWLFLRSPSHRWPAAIMLTSVVVNRILFVLNAIHHPIERYLPSDISLVGIAALVFAVSLFGFRILNPIAQAPLAATNQMSDAMLVIDAEGLVASINPAAEVMLGVAARDARGRPVRSLLPTGCGVDQPLGGTGLLTTECTLGAGPTSRQVAVSCTQLKDWRGLASGRLILLRDVSEERKAQAQILDQQRSLATLTERERLARELHDSLGQMLAAAHLQVATASLLLEQGKLAAVDGCLTSVGEMALAAEVDVRDYILGAKSFSTGGTPFLEALRHHLQRFGLLHGLDTELVLPADLDVRRLAPSTETQLLRIVQEALSNIRKHANARSCRVEFAVNGPMLQVKVTDDGRGFDLTAYAKQHGDGYGLHTMRERATSLGGNLRLTSQPGKGTCVTIEVPLEEAAGVQTSAATRA